MFKLGSIRKIEVKNFVTYSYVELYPGPNLNMLIGPNGTGKSTIVAAIILGLGGNPKVVGRGSKVSEFVKHNCNEATINIYLQGHSERDFIKITRNFTIGDKSTWTINNQKVLVRDVIDCIKQFNIQVDNMCQFLPQDRVQDFAKMNQQQLLKETQMALCRDDLIEKQQILIECRSNHKRLMEIVERKSAKLQENQDANMRVESKIENFSKKKQFLCKIQDIDRKMAWVHYDQLYETLRETKIDYKKATEVYEKHKNAAKPIEKEIQEAKKIISELQQINSNVTRSIRESETSSRNYIEKIDENKYQIREIEAAMNSRIAEIEQRNAEIEATASKIEEMRVAQGQLLEKCGKDEEIQQKVAKITNEIQKFKRHISDLQNHKEELIHEKQNKIAQLRAYENEKARLENVKQQRLNYLQKKDQDAYEAVIWLRNNKHLFQEEVYEPIMLELNVLEAKNAIYVENVIPFRDRVAFTCVNKNDMNTLIKHLRVEKKLNVNVLHSGNTGERASNYQPTIPIEQLRRFGLYTYLHSLFTAPNPIMGYLCRTYQVHNIPIGTDQTNKFYEEIPKEIRIFFSDTHRFSVKFSKYTGTRSTLQNEISSDGGLSISLDVLYLERLNGQISEYKATFSKYEMQVTELDNQVALINEKVGKLSEELKYFHSVKQQVQIIETRIISMQRKIEEMRQSAVTPDLIKAQAENKIKRVVGGIRQLVDHLLANYKILTNLNVKNSLNMIKIEKCRKRVAYLENQGEETCRLMSESESTMNKIKEVFVNIKGQAKAALEKAKILSKNFTPDDEGFDEFRQTYNILSSDISTLEEEKNELSAKIHCLNSADDDEIREYEERVELIKELQEGIAQGHVELSRAVAKMDKLQKEWLQPLQQLILQINTNFATSFERIGCAGEVSLNKGDDEQEFADYGLCIKVTYRNGEPMQELNNVVQSGGERAVATAIFLMALQELTPVPFRCVDEINQGMDINNERRIFDLLVESTSQPDTSQYFLVTPKLVPGLNYSRSIMVHFVHNGPFVEADRKWSTSKSCNPQGFQLH